MKISDKLVFNDRLKARNRIVMPPMDTLMAHDGHANDFHIQHYGARSYGGVGTIIVESTAVAPEGRIRDSDLGLWSKKHLEPMAKVANIIKQGGALAGVQLNHAGAKSQVTKNTAFGPTTFYSYLDNNRTFRLMTEQDLKRVGAQFIKAARYAKKAAFDFVEIHGAHGYLINELLHPQLNTVFPGDDVLVRGAFLIAIVKSISEKVKIPVGIRLSVSDHDPKGVDVEYYAKLIKALSPYVIYFNVSSGEAIGSIRSDELIKVLNNKIFRLPLAKKVKQMTEKIVFTGGNVSTKEDVMELLRSKIDGAFIGRELLFNPNHVVNNLLDVEEIDNQHYHWNSNPWYTHHDYLAMMKKLKLK